LKKEVRALKAEVGKLQTKNAKLETENVSARLRIKALEKLKVLPESKSIDLRDAARRILFVLSMAKKEGAITDEEINAAMRRK
jgi:hypothetical protein